MSFVNGVGLLSGTLGLINFAISHIPTSPGPNGAKIKIKLNGDDAHHMNAGGTLHRADGFGYGNNYLGESNGVNVHRGDTGVIDVYLNQNKPDNQAFYLSVTAAQDAFCWSYITVKQHDHSFQAGITGDISRVCGAGWYMGNQGAGRYKNDKKTPKAKRGKVYVPACGWLDKDHTHGKYTSMKFALSAFGDSASGDSTNAQHCKRVIFNKKFGPITAKPGPPTKRSERHPKRDLSELDDYILHTLVESDIEDQQAADLCESETSYGPDFIGTDGMFCDMRSKELYPLCSTDNVIGCVDLDKIGSELLLKTGDSIWDPLRSYKYLEYWNQTAIEEKMMLEMEKSG